MVKRWVRRQPPKPWVRRPGRSREQTFPIYQPTSSSDLPALIAPQSQQKVGTAHVWTWYLGHLWARERVTRNLQNNPGRQGDHGCCFADGGIRHHPVFQCRYASGSILLAVPVSMKSIPLVRITSRNSRGMRCRNWRSVPTSPFPQRSWTARAMGSPRRSSSFTPQCPGMDCGPSRMNGRTSATWPPSKSSVLIACWIGRISFFRPLTRSPLTRIRSA